MKKLKDNLLCQFLRSRKQVIFTTCLIISALLSFAPELSAQQIEINLDIKQSSIKDVYSLIEQKTGTRFFYSDDMLDLNKLISIKIENGSLKTLIYELVNKTGLRYKVEEDNLVVVSPREKINKSFKIKGKVISANDELGLPGVNVFVKGTVKGTITDFDGNYEIVLSDPNVTLVYSFIGFNQQELAVNGRSIINVSLQENVESLDEVVVTALNIQRNKSSLGYSVTQVGSDEISQAKENNPVNSLAGKVAGLQITRASTGVDGSSRVVLRGVSSLLGNNRPLFVIDGIPMESSYGGGGRWGGTDSGDALSDLNAEDIESMTVLKGAGAAAAYGSRGANGVILVTTKKGKSRTGLGVSISSGYTIETPMVTPDFQNEYGHGAFGQYPGLAGNPPAPLKDYPWIWSYGPKMEGQTEIDWLGNEAPVSPQSNPYKEFFRTGATFTNTVAFNGGNETSSFRASVTSQDSKGIMPNNGLKRQTINLRGTSQLSEEFGFDAKLTYIRSTVENRPYLAESGKNIVQAIGIMPRNISLESLKNNTADELGNEMKWNTDNTFGNPYWILENIGNNDEKHRIQAMFQMKWDILKNLSLMGRTGFDFSNKRYRSFENPGQPNIEKGTGSMSQNMNNGIEWNTDVLMAFNKELEDVNFNVSVGGNYRYNENLSMSQSGYAMRIPNFYHISNYKGFGTGEWYSQKEVYSAYALGTVSYKNVVYLDVTARNDWSSTLPLENNAYFYHSENLSFLFSDVFKINKDILTKGKIRASFAKVGNDTSPYQIEQYYNISQTNTEFPQASIGGQLPYFDLKPEETSSWEVGTNLGFFKNRLILDVAYYYSISDNQIMNVSLTPSTGYSTKKMNAGKLQNTGLEIQLNGNPVSSKNGFNWDVILTWSKNNSLVKALYGDMKYLSLADEFHMSIEAHIDQPFGIMYALDYKRDAFGNKLIDKNGYAQTGDWKAMGDLNPDWNAGISNQFSYKGFNVSCLVDIQKGGDIYSWGKAYRALFGTSAETLEGRDEWYAGTGGYIEEGILESNGQQNDIAIQPTYRWYNLFNKQIGTEWMMDATNVRMREVVVGYTLPSKWLSVSLVGRNLFFFYKAMDHVDPESGFNSGNTGSAIEHMSLPSTSSYGLSLKLNF